MVRLEDPLEAYNGLSIFRRTFGGSLPPNPIVKDDDELLSAHIFLNNLPVKNRDKLMKQGKSILDESSEPVNAEMLNDAIDEVVEKIMESPRARRPGLGRKRPRFSILPDSSQLTMNLEPSLDIDKLQDPVEFFTAFERQQDARKEIEKQTGRVSTDSNQCITSMVPRPRRPGIPGRSRTVKYHHLYPVKSSQETFQEHILSPSNHDSQQETDNLDGALQLRESANFASEESELAGTMSKTEKRVEKLLDELLAHDYEELDEDRAVALLQDRLQIKSLDIQKLNLPELQDVRRTDMKSLGGNVSKSRTVLSDIHNLLKRNRTPMKQQNAENSAPSFGSPTPPKSPLSSLSLMLKHRMQSNPATDPYSAVDIDCSPVTNASSFENVNRSSDVVDMEKDFSISGKLNSLMIETKAKMAGDISPHKVAIGDSGSPSDKHVNDNLTSLGSGSDIRPSKYSALVEDNNVGGNNWVIDENLNQPGVNVDSQTDGPNEMEDMVEDVQQKALASAQTSGTAMETPNDTHNQFEQSISAVAEDHTMDVCLKTHDSAEQRQDNAPEHHNQRVEEPPAIIMNRQTKAKSCSGKESKNSLSRRQSLAEQSSPAVAEDHTMDGSLETNEITPEERQDIAPEQHNERVEEPPVMSMNKRTKSKSRPSRESKRSLSRRQSLAASGTSWETGVRRSTRIRSRPLEYWKGERFLYGRIHGSLATVIGIKYESPGKDAGRPTIKVKSFVSDEYKDLVELAALH